MNKKSFWFGLIFIAILTCAVLLLSTSPWALHWQISTLTIAILLGIVIGNSVYQKFSLYLCDGVNFAKTTLLRLGIVLYGFRLTLQDISQVGINAIAADAIMLITTFFITAWLGIRYFQMEKQTVYLAAAGCSICGAAAVMATSPVVKAQSHQTSVAIAIVVIFGTISMFGYPMMYPYLADYLNPHQYGIYIGSTVHEVAQVYAAGGSISADVANTAVISKMIRVMMLAPFLVCLSWLFAKEQGASGKINIPWFAVYFIAVAVFNSFNLLPTHWVKYIVEMDSLLLIAAMTALGLTTHISAIRQAGVNPLLLGMFVLCWLVIGGFGVNVVMGIWL